MMKITAVLLTAFCCISASLGAQTINGSVRDEKQAAITGATVSLLQAADSAWVRSEVSDAGGAFRLQGEPGAYLLEVVAEGFLPQRKPVTLVREEAVQVTVRLEAAAGELRGVTVSSRRPFIELKPGMMVVNIEGSPASSGNSALELLRRSPGVQVSAEGEISMKGKNGVQVYVDGRPLRLSGDQLTAYLRSMTAEEIAQLELISQPGSKYDAAGTAGIINIRTRSIKKQGINGNLSATGTRATYAFGNLSGRITYRYGRLTLYASEYFNYARQYNSLQVDRRYIDASGAAAGSVLTDQDVNFDSRFSRIKAGGEYALSDKTTIGARVQLPSGNPEIDYRSLTKVQDAAGAASYLRGDRSMSNHWNEKEFGLFGRHRFGAGRELSFDAFTVSNRSGDAGYFYNTPVNAAGEPLGAEEAWYVHFPVHIRLNVAQADYSQSLGEKWKLESGLKYTQVGIDYTSDYRLPDAGGVFVPDLQRSNHFLYNEMVPAAYTTLSCALSPKLDASAGLRAEQTLSEGRVTTSGEAFSRAYLSLFPTLFASYRPDSLHTFTFSYGRRLDRPNYGLLNPARDYIDKYSYRVGNPRLMPQFVNNFELAWSWKGQMVLTLNYARTRGIISDFFVQDDKTKTAYEIHDNFAGFRQAGLNVNYNRELTSWWTVNLYAEAYLVRFTGDYFGEGFSLDGSVSSMNCSNQFSFSKGWAAELSGWVNGPSRNTIFTESAPYGSLDLGVSKKLLSDSMTIRLAVNDVLGTQHYSGSNRFANFDTDVKSTWDARRAALSINYNFGSRIETLQRKGEGEGRRM